MQWRAVPPSAVWVGALVVALKLILSAPQLSQDVAETAITWVVVLAFVGIGLLLFASDVPSVNGWACIAMAASTIPGDLNSKFYAGSWAALIGFVFEPLYLAAAVALVLRYPDGMLPTAARRLVVALIVVTVGDRILTALTTGRLEDGYYRGDRSTRAFSLAWHDGVFVRGGRTVCALLLLVAVVLLAARLKHSSGPLWAAAAVVVGLGILTATAAAADQLVWVIGTPAARAVPAALARNLAAALIPTALLIDLLLRRTIRLTELAEGLDHAQHAALAARERADHAAAEERQRVQWDLHDGAQQHFLAASATISRLALVVGPDFRPLLTEAQAILRGGLVELRGLSRGEDPVDLADGLGSALDRLAARSPVPIEISIAPDIPDLDRHTAAALYFAAAELLVNAVRHGEATAVSVAVTRREDAVELIVADQGHGGAVSPGGGGGLDGLEGRLSRLGGALRVEPSPGSGWTVHATLPVAP